MEFVKSCALATVFTPQFKLDWIQNPTKRAAIKLLCLKEAETEGLRMGKANQFKSPPRGGKGRFSYSFMSGDKENHCEVFPSNEAISNMSQLEFLTFLNQDHAEGLYMKYNVILPSSAPVERLFSIAGIISSARRSRLEPGLLEKLLLLSVNNKLDAQPCASTKFYDLRAIYPLLKIISSSFAKTELFCKSPIIIAKNPVFVLGTFENSQNTYVGLKKKRRNGKKNYSKIIRITRSLFVNNE